MMVDVVLVLPVLVRVAATVTALAVLVLIGWLTHRLVGGVARRAGSEVDPRGRADVPVALSARRTA
ncbi:hypothetical protein WEH80_23370 [Actinomycetes bacterium KLBMP 9759]